MAVAVLGAPTVQANEKGDDGCTPGYWKNHTENWFDGANNTGPIRTTKLVESVWPAAGDYAVGDKTFLQALQGGGGSGLEGAALILARAAVAAWLNAAHEGLGYPLSRAGDINPLVNAAFESDSRAEMLEVAAYLDSLNNSDCPLN
jgi:hypothetical protein